MDFFIFLFFAVLGYFLYEKVYKKYQKEKGLVLFQKDLQKYGYLIRPKEYLKRVQNDFFCAV